VNDTAERLMDLAEAHMRNGGYAGFSFRDLAAELGIKSASVHHHFPTKATRLPPSLDVTRNVFLLLLHGARTPKTQSPLTGQHSKRHSAETG
jgi:AcrR family transcriptional regulator